MFVCACAMRAGVCVCGVCVCVCVCASENVEFVGFAIGSRHEGLIGDWLFDGYDA